MRRRDKLVDHALDALSHTDPETRQRAVDLIAHRLRVRGHQRHAPRQIDQSFAALTRVLRDDPSEDVRHAAAYALTFWFEHRAAWALVPVLLDEKETPHVRGQAAEGIGNQLTECPLPSPRYDQAVHAVAAGLRDPSSEVRFWCIYAAGQLKLAHLRPDIERLRDTDEALCPGLWYVRDEAADVLAYLDTGVWPERDFVREIPLGEPVSTP